MFKIVSSPFSYLVNGCKNTAKTYEIAPTAPPRGPPVTAGVEEAEPDADVEFEEPSVAVARTLLACVPLGQVVTAATLIISKCRAAVSRGGRTCAVR